MKLCPNCNSTKIKKYRKGKKVITVCKNCGFYNEFVTK